jgi:hypothetical protein
MRGQHGVDPQMIQDRPDLIDSGRHGRPQGIGVPGVELVLQQPGPVSLVGKVDQVQELISIFTGPRTPPVPLASG